MPWEVFEYEGSDAALQLERDWLRIYSSMPLRSVYHSLHGHRLYARHLRFADGRMRYFGLYDGGRTRAICPLEATIDHSLGIPTRVLGTPVHRHWPLSDVICPEDEARAALIPALTDYLDRTGERRLLRVGPLPVRSMLWNGVRNLAPHRFCACEIETFDVFHCTSPLDVLLARSEGSHYRKVRRGQRRLNELPGLLHRQVVDGPEVPREFEHFLELEASGWKADAGNVIEFQPDVEAFYRGLLTLDEAGDHVVILSITTEGRHIASALGVRTGSQLTAIKTAYDEAYARFGPGVQVFRDCLEYCCKDPCIIVLNLIGSPAWARRWRPEAVTMGRAYFSLKGPAGRARVAGLSVAYGPARPILHRIREQVDRVRSTRGERQDGAASRSTPA